MRSSRSDRAVVATFLCIAFLWTLTLSASPRLHQRVHRDANRADHVCAITMVASGNYNHSPCAPLISAPISTFDFCQKLVLNSVWVQSLFLGARVFEHAPPTSV